MKFRVGWATIVFVALAVLSNYIVFPVFARLMQLPSLRAHPAEVIAIIVGVFATSVALARALIDPSRPSDDTVMLPTLFAVGVSMTVGFLVLFQIWDLDNDPGRNIPPAVGPLVFLTIVISGASLGFWWGVRRYKRLRS